MNKNKTKKDWPIGNKEETKNWIINTIKNYVESKHIKYEYYEASTGSGYFTFLINEDYETNPKLRIADHQPNYFVHTISYDMIGKNTKKETVRKHIYRVVDNTIERGRKFNLANILNNIDNKEKKDD